MTELNRHSNGNGRRTLTQWGTIAIAIVAMVGSIIGVYTSIQSELTENRRSIEDVRQSLSNLERRTETALAEQKAYNAELRSRIVDADKEIRESIRMLVVKLIDKDKP